MKGIRKRLAALLLSCAVFAVSVLGRCQPVSAAAIAGPATAAGIAAGETLEFLYSVLMSVGITLNLKEMIRYHDPTDGYTWLDEPASQEDINNLEKKIEEYYDNAVRDWYINHGGKITPSPEPTKTPGTDPVPVTPAPTSIPPDISEKIDSWNEMKKKALEKKVLTMTAVAGACLKEAVTGWWDNIMDTAPDANEKISSEEANIILSSGCSYYEIGNYNSRYVRNLCLFGSRSFIYEDKEIVTFNEIKNYSNGEYSNTSGKDGAYTSTISFLAHPAYYNVVSTLPKFSTFEEGQKWLDEQDEQTVDSTEKIPSKNIILPVPNLKKLLDDNKKSPDLPMPISITLPNLDEIKDLVKDADKADDDDKPTIVQTFINNHTYTEPEPTQAPDPDPNPTGSPSTDPDPTGSPETTPSVTPATPGDIDIKPKPTTAPGTDPDGGGGGTGTDPDNPDSGGADLDSYKTDLRLVFPFCIPFDLIHLLNVLDAEPEAPRFEIPVDIEVDNPFPRARSEGKMIDYETTIVIDMSDYEEPIKVIRIFEIIFFIIGLMLITRQHMIKG